MKIMNLFSKILILLAVLLISANYTYAIDENLCDDICEQAGEWVSETTIPIQYPGTDCIITVTFSYRWNPCRNDCDIKISEDGGIKLSPATCTNVVNPKEALEFAMQFLVETIDLYIPYSECVPQGENTHPYIFYVKGCYHWVGYLDPINGQSATLVACDNIGCCIYTLVVGRVNNNQLEMINMSADVNSVCTDPDYDCFTICEEE
jgi:hypothetical protein